MSAPLRILLADDNERIHAALREGFRDAGPGSAQLESAYHPLAVLSRLRNSEARDVDLVLDVVLLDVQFDNAGLTGLDILPKLRQLCPDLPVILLAGMDIDRIEAKTKAVASVSCLRKPVGMTSLCEKIDEVVGLQRMQGGRFDQGLRDLDGVFSFAIIEEVRRRVAIDVVRDQLPAHTSWLPDDGLFRDLLKAKGSHARSTQEKLTEAGRQQLVESATSAYATAIEHIFRLLGENARPYLAAWSDCYLAESVEEQAVVRRDLEQQFEARLRDLRLWDRLGSSRKHLKRAVKTMEILKCLRDPMLTCGDGLLLWLLPLVIGDGDAGVASRRSYAQRIAAALAQDPELFNHLRRAIHLRNNVRKKPTHPKWKACDPAEMDALDPAEMDALDPAEMDALIVKLWGAIASAMPAEAAS